MPLRAVVDDDALEAVAPARLRDPGARAVAAPRENAARYAAASRSFAGEPASAAPKPASAPNDACSATSATSAPGLARCAATASSSGPEPAPRRRRGPASEAPHFASACAPPAPKTPGSVQPGKRQEELARARREDEAPRRHRERRSAASAEEREPLAGAARVRDGRAARPGGRRSARAARATRARPRGGGRPGRRRWICPPGAAASSSRSVRAPDSAARHGRRDAGGPRADHGDVAVERLALDGPAAADADAAVRLDEHAVADELHAGAPVRRRRRSSTRHSKQIPIAQRTPRGSPADGRAQPRDAGVPERRARPSMPASAEDGAAVDRQRARAQACAASGSSRVGR